MVSKAREDLPLPLMPVMTTSCSRGMRRLMDLRLCSLAPVIVIQPSLSTIALADVGVPLPDGASGIGGVVGSADPDCNREAEVDVFFCVFATGGLKRGAKIREKWTKKQS